MIRPAPGPTADAVVDVQVQRTGGESRLKDEEVVLFFLAEKRAERTCGEEKMATPGWTEKKRSSAPLRRGGVPQKIYWEGNILNKISKKIVSAVTMGAFALTLIPAAAFAAPLEAASDKYADVDLVSSATTYNNTVTLKVDLDTQGFERANDLIGIWIDADENGFADAGAIEDVTTSLDTQTVSVFPEARDNAASAWENAWFSDDLNNVTGDDFTVTVDLAGTGDQVLHVGVFDKSARDKSQGNDRLNTLSAATTFDITVATTDAVAKGSSVMIDGYTGTATKAATAGEPQKFTVSVRNADGQITDLPFANDIYVWAEDKNGDVVTDAVFDAEDADANTVAPVTDRAGIYTASNVSSDSVLTVTIPDAGDDYTINAATEEPTAHGNQVIVVAGTKINPIELDVAAKPVVAKDIVVDSVTDADYIAGNTATDSYEFRVKDEVTPSKTKEYTVTGHAWVGDKMPAEEVEVTITPDAGMTIVGDTTVKTDNNGKFTFKYKVDDAASYIVKLVSGDAVSYLKITHGDVDAVHIEKIADGGKVLAGTDKDYAGQVYDGSALFSDAIQIGITDAYGRDAVGKGVLADEAAANADRTGLDHSDAVSVEKWAEGSDVDADDFYLAWDEDAGVYTLEYRGEAKNLTPGDYAVRIALNNGGDNAITVNFTAVEFGTVQDIVLDMTARPAGTWDTDADNFNAIHVIDDQVALGQRVDVTPKYVDENGLKVEIENYRHLNVGINGEAVAKNGYIWFTTQDNIAANNSLVGSTITVKVNDQNTNLYVEKELTVVKNYLNETVTIDPTEGAVGKANTVNVSVVDEDGNLSKVNGKLTASIVGQSEEEAVVDLKVNPDVRNGKASMYLESDKAGTVDVRVVVTANNGELYADTFTYTFGDEDPYAGSYVVMTIGSDQYLINNEVLDGSVDNLGAPYVDSAWRTMVPVRVLAESFGAEVTFDEEAQTVTIVDGDTTIVMTVGSTEYTINGEAAEAMDTAPVIGSDNRTYVPVRFVAEGLGYEVTPLYNAENGTTASVVFQK